MNKDFNKIDKIAQLKDEEEEERYYNKYREIFDVSFKFLSKHKVLLYGGMAINELLPDKLKIYKPSTIPDIDVFSENGLELAKKMVVFFNKKGYSHITTSYTEALHKNTYKVYVESVQVADISTVSKKAFKHLSENSVMAQNFQIKIVNPQFLRMSLHLIMSKGDADSVHRWRKVLPRLVAFYKAFPPTPCKMDEIQAPKNQDISKISDEMINALYHVVKTTDYVLFGMHEIELLLEKQLRSRIFDASIQMFVHDNNLEAVAKTFVSRIVDENKEIEGTSRARNKELLHFKISQLYDADEFVSKHVVISYKGEHMITMFHASDCLGFTEYKGYRIASIHTIIRMYISFMLSNYNHLRKHIHSLECMVNTLTIKLIKMQGTNKKLFQDVVSQCYGTNAGLITMRKERMIRIAKKNDD